jgi:hypothetical protein
MAALVYFLPVMSLVVEVVAEGPPPLVRQVWISTEAAAVLASPSPSQAPPPHTLEEAGGWELLMLVSCQALEGQGVGAKAVTLTAPFQLPLVLPTLVVGVGVETLEQQVAPAS